MKTIEIKGYVSEHAYKGWSKTDVPQFIAVFKDKDKRTNVPATITIRGERGDA